MVGLVLHDFIYGVCLVAFLILIAGWLPLGVANRGRHHKNCVCLYCERDDPGKAKRLGRRNT